MVSPPNILFQKGKIHVSNQLNNQMLLRSIINRILIGFEQVYLIMVIINIIIIIILIIINTNIAGLQPVWPRVKLLVLL